MVKHFCEVSSCVSFGDGTTFVRCGLNDRSEGLVSIYNTNEYGEPSMDLVETPEDVNLECPDVAMLFRTPKDIELHIETLQQLKELMESEQKEKKDV